jgi:hypothetical protein
VSRVAITDTESLEVVIHLRTPFKEWVFWKCTNPDVRSRTHPLEFFFVESVTCDQVKVRNERDRFVLEPTMPDSEGEVIPVRVRGRAPRVWRTTLVWFEGIGILVRPSNREDNLSPTEFADYWAMLGAEDAATAYRLQGLMAADWPRTLERLRERVVPVLRITQGELEQMFTDLASDTAPLIVRARKKALTLRDTIAPKLKEFVESKIDRTLTHEAKRLLDQLEPEQRRADAAIRVLERIGNGEAWRLLVDLASGAPEAKLTKEAQAALDRIKKRKREQELNPLPRPTSGIPLPLP